MPLESGELEGVTSSPALMDLNSPVTALIASFRISGYKIAIGCQDGLVKFLRCPLDGSPSLTSRLSLDGPISSVLFLRIKPNVTDLLVTSACGYACYFAGIATKLLVSPVVIVPPAQDSLTSAVACDVDFDGEKEVLLGSYSQEVYCYKLQSCEFQLLWTLRLEHPVMGIATLDFNLDGVLEVCVLTMYGVCVYHPSFELALQKLRRVKKFLSDSEVHSFPTPH